MDTQTLPEQTITQRPAIRLLDLLAGWNDFVARAQDRTEEPVQDDLLPSSDIYDLYHEAAEWAFDRAESESREEEEAVWAFLNERILPLLLR